MAETTIDLTVIGDETMHCAGCVQRVKNVLLRVDGVQNVDASFETQNVRVVADPERVTPEQLQEKLRGIGYETRTTMPAA